MRKIIFLVLFGLMGLGLNAQPHPFTGDISLVINPLPEPFAYDTLWVMQHNIKSISWTNYEANSKGKLNKKSGWVKDMGFDTLGRLVSLSQSSKSLGAFGYNFNYRGDNGCPIREGDDGFSFGCNGFGHLTLIRGPVDTSEYIYNDSAQVIQEIYKGQDVPEMADFEVNLIQYDDQQRMTQYLKQDARAVVNATEGGEDTLYCNVTKINYAYEGKFLTGITEYFAETEFNRAYPNEFDTTAINIVYAEYQNNGSRLTSATFYYPEGDKGYADFVYGDEGWVEEIQYYSINKKGLKVWDSVVFMEYETWEEEESEQ